MSLNQFSQRYAHFLLDCDWVVDVSANTEELGARVFVAAEAVKPAGASAHDSGADCHSFDVRNRGWAPVQTSVGWEGRLQAGASWLALKALDQAGLLATDVGTSS